MNSEIKEKEISEYSNKEIELFLKSEDCIEAGVVLISNNEKKVKLGAMNPIYQKVLDIKDELINKFKVDVEVSQITTEEWEKWNKSEDSFKDTNQIIDTPNLSTHTDKKEQSIDNKPSEISDSEEDKFTDQNTSKGSTKKNKSLLEEMLNNEFSEELKDKQDDKFDFFDFEDDTEDEDELDIIEDSDLENNDDPVIKAAGSILSTCSRLKASDIHAEPLEERMRIRYRLMGFLKKFILCQRLKLKQ